MSLFESEVPIQDVITTNPEKAKALENEVRAKILDMLAVEVMICQRLSSDSLDTSKLELDKPLYNILKEKLTKMMF